MPDVFVKSDRSNHNFLFKKCACLFAKDTECVPVSLNYDRCCAFQNSQHVTFYIVGNFLYAKGG